jgi:hypothetical protein
MKKVTEGEVNRNNIPLSRFMVPMNKSKRSKENQREKRTRNRKRSGVSKKKNHEGYQECRGCRNIAQCNGVRGVGGERFRSKDIRGVGEGDWDWRKVRGFVEEIQKFNVITDVWESSGTRRGWEVGRDMV